MADGEILVARTSGVIMHGGRRHLIHKGTTRVRVGHPILKGHERMFEPLSVHYDVEQATAAPGEKRSLPVTGELVELRRRAEELGVSVDKRWGVDRLRKEIADLQAEED